MRKFELTLTRDYVSKWGLADAVRELFQNALDAGEMSWDFNNGTLSICNANAKLDTSSLLLGATTKKAGTTIGQYGEGYKLAALVLCRLGYRFTIHTGAEVWTPRLVKSRRYNAEILTFFIEDAPSPITDVVMTVSGLSASDWSDAIVPTCLFLRRSVVNDYVVIHHTEYGDVLDLPGEVYIGGLHVCTLKDYKHGYDFRPGILNVERDRRLASEFDVSWYASHMWTPKYEEDEDLSAIESSHLLDLLFAGSPDVKYLNLHTTSHKLKRAAHSRFLRTFGPEAVPTLNSGDAVPRGYIGVMVCSALYSLITAADTYKSPVPEPTPLERWYKKWQHLLTNAADEELQEIIKRI